MKIYINRKIFIGFLSSIAVVLGLAVFSYLYFTELISVTRWSAHSRRILFHSEQIRSYAMEMETAQRGYGLTGEEVFLKSYPESEQLLQSNLKDLDSLVQDNTIQVPRVNLLKGIVDDKIKFSSEVVKVRKTDFEKAKEMVETLRGKNQMDEIDSLVKEIQNEETRLISDRSQKARSKFTLVILTFAGLILATLIILLILTFMINANLKSRTQAEEELKKAELETRKTNQELESFSYSVSHDLRAPLRSIDGYSQILLEDYQSKLDETGKRTIGIIISNAKKMGQLIDDLLDFSRLGKTEVRSVNIDMLALVNSVIEELMSRQEGREVDWVIQPLGIIRADNNMMRQVWINLLSNALKYSRRRDRSRIEINLSETTDEKIYSVSDNGTGFDPQYTHKLFDVFQRLHKTTEFEGTGVGLALVKRIIDRHHGRVWAESVLNEGATFYFSIPNKN